ncbi:hypothetical protein PG984_016518 [Apiospora sp. TS-2023a]
MRIWDRVPRVPAGGKISWRRDNEKCFEEENSPYKLFKSAPHIINGLYFPEDPMKGTPRTPGRPGAAAGRASAGATAAA